eukprot:CAMPEP_0117653590 /NCGR_PEP_ID=MMETSP0804-20121206/3276_1 /TAXON_ID=1074897 /ORGANISM="Tetraselmis astigmatica, Strain CCMP880" /LENGTH=185 /DNA_ID=CAMNT_0005459783 /DNA_START=601 /DNA_END=1158 /DNA_ORIENTATION=-
MRWPRVMETTASKLVAPTLASYTAAAFIASVAVVSVIAVVGGIGFGVAALVDRQRRSATAEERARKGKAPVVVEEKWERMDYVAGGAGPSKSMSTVVEDMEMAMESDCRRRGTAFGHSALTIREPLPEKPAISSHPVFVATAAEPGVPAGAEAAFAPAWSGMCSGAAGGRQQGPLHRSKPVAAAT